MMQELHSLSFSFKNLYIEKIFTGKFISPEIYIRTNVIATVKLVVSSNGVLQLKTSG
jgi:hypothetical protein